MTVIGTRLPRQEDPRLLRGRGRFGDDMNVPGQLHARIVRSPAAHGRVQALDVTGAARAPGVTAVVTAEDLPDGIVIPVRLAIAGTEGLLVTYARCCFPIPYDPIFAFLSSGRGVVIHAPQCLP